LALQSGCGGTKKRQREKTQKERDRKKTNLTAIFQRIRIYQGLQKKSSLAGFYFSFGRRPWLLASGLTALVDFFRGFYFSFGPARSKGIQRQGEQGRSQRAEEQGEGLSLLPLSSPTSSEK
jgi:hypothetical protein